MEQVLKCYRNHNLFLFCFISSRGRQKMLKFAADAYFGVCLCIFAYSFDPLETKKFVVSALMCALFPNSAISKLRKALHFFLLQMMSGTVRAQVWNLFPRSLAALAYWLLSVVIVHDDVRAISYFSHFLIKKGVTFFSAAQNVRHSARLGADLFPMLFGLICLLFIQCCHCS